MADLNVGSFGKKSNIDLKKLQAGMKAEQLKPRKKNLSLTRLIKMAMELLMQMN